MANSRLIAFLKMFLNFPSLFCRLPLLLLFAIVLPALADDTVAIDTSNPVGTSKDQSGVALSAEKRLGDPLNGKLWMVERDQIRAAKENRIKPTDRGIWYSQQSNQEKVGHYISYGVAPIIASEAAYLAMSGPNGRDAAVQGIASVAVAGGITMAIKKTFRRRRPYPNDDQFGSFPSGHTSVAFAMAGVLGAAQPGLKVPAYIAAGAVGWARVKVRAHHWRDVVAGAALGLTVANQFHPNETVRGPLAKLRVVF